MVGEENQLLSLPSTSHLGTGISKLYIVVKMHSYGAELSKFLGDLTFASNELGVALEPAKMVIRVFS